MEGWLDKDSTQLRTENEDGARMSPVNVFHHKSYLDAGPGGVKEIDSSFEIDLDLRKLSGSFPEKGSSDNIKRIVDPIVNECEQRYAQVDSDQFIAKKEARSSRVWINVFPKRFEPILAPDGRSIISLSKTLSSRVVKNNRAKFGSLAGLSLKPDQD